MYVQANKSPPPQQNGDDDDDDDDNNNNDDDAEKDEKVETEDGDGDVAAVHILSDPSSAICQERTIRT